MGKRMVRLMDLVDSSEMVCSLRYESIAGCPYHSFTPRGIAVLSSVSAAFAVLSLITGM